MSSASSIICRKLRKLKSNGLNSSSIVYDAAIDHCIAEVKKCFPKRKLHVYPHKITDSTVAVTEKPE